MNASRRAGRRDRVPLDAPVPCRNYEIWGPHPQTGLRACLWVGEVVDTPNRGPRDRFGEHLDSVWGDTIPTRDYDQALADGTFVLHPQIYPTKRDALIAERARIIALEPLYNWEENHLNPNQIPKWDQEAQRAERDKHRGVPPHLTWAAIHGRVPVAWWRRPLTWWAGLRPRQRRRYVAITIGVDLALASGVALFVLSPLSMLTSLAVTGGVVAWLALWFNKPSRRRRIRYALNEAARYALIGAVGVQLYYELFR